MGGSGWEWVVARFTTAHYQTNNFRVKRKYSVILLILYGRLAKRALI